MSTFMMPAGRYWVGDLCYVMHPQWEEVCSKIISGNDCVDGQFVLENKVKFAQFGTMYGDGRYNDQFGNEYPVDAGLIGCIRVEDISDEKSWMEGGNIVEFATDFECSEDNGVMYFGHIRINTGDDEEEYNEYIEDEEEQD